MQPAVTYSSSLGELGDFVDTFVQQIVGHFKKQGKHMVSFGRKVNKSTKLIFFLRGAPQIDMGLLAYWCLLIPYNILYPYEDETRDIRSNIALCLEEFPRAKPKGTPEGKGLYLTVDSDLSPNTDIISF